MREISARLFRKISIIWLVILLFFLVAVYIGGEKPFSQAFIVSLFAYLGLIMWVILTIASYILERVEELEKKIRKE